MNRKFIMCFFCFSCIVFIIGGAMNIFSNPLSCDEGYSLKNGKCSKYEYAPYLSNSCDVGYVLNDGQCVKYLKYNDFDKYKTCGIEQSENADVVYKDGKCHIAKYLYPNIEYSCDKDYSLNESKMCYKETIIDATFNEDDIYVCPTGYTLVNENQCTKIDYKDPVQTSKCDNTDTEFKNDLCYYKTEDIIETKACLKGEVLIEDKCYVLSEETKKPVSVCPYGYTDDNGQCKKEFIKEPIKKH